MVIWAIGSNPKSNWNLDHKIMGKTDHNDMAICHLNGRKKKPQQHNTTQRGLGHKPGKTNV